VRYEVGTFWAFTLQQQMPSLPVLALHSLIYQMYAAYYFTSIPVLSASEKVQLATEEN